MEKTTEKLIDALLSSQRQINTLLKSVADDQDWQPDSEEWSFRYIAAHLSTVEKDCFLDRVSRIASGEDPQFSYYLNTGWDFSQYDLRDSLQDWSHTRQVLIDYVQALPEEKLSLTGTHVKFGTMTVLDVLQTMHDHDLEHLQELEEVIATHEPQAIENRCQTEVIELHQFFEDWFNGNLALTIENSARFADVLSKDFVIIEPGGRVTERAPLITNLRDAHNSRINLKIWIENFRFHRREGNIAIATYEEWQHVADGDTTSRLSTVVFREEAGTPNRLVWLHVHETWLEE